MHAVKLLWDCKHDPGLELFAAWPESSGANALPALERPLKVSQTGNWCLAAAFRVLKWRGVLGV